jgi:hypothetical protein
VSAPAWVSYAALIVSLLALVVSIVVAGWNVYTWRSGGPQLTLVAHDRPVGARNCAHSP